MHNTFALTVRVIASSIAELRIPIGIFPLISAWPLGERSSEPVGGAAKEFGEEVAAVGGGIRVCLFDNFGCSCTFRFPVVSISMFR